MKYLIHVSGNHRGVSKFWVDAIEVVSGLNGHIHDGKRYIPDIKQISHGLPKRWLHIIGACSGFWYDKHDNNKPCHYQLTDYRHRYIATVYAQPYYDK